ncbi:MAG: class I SAM-dependent methyltransferase [Candidatus Woesearchaeota archaeon]|jgi:predicted O-methyltransferase YrrM
MTNLRKATFLPPTEIAGPLGKRFARYPGPFPIGYSDLQRIFSGMMDESYNPEKYPNPIYGTMNGTEREFLIRLVRWLKPKRIVEYGTQYGLTTQILAEESPSDARILTVDLPDEVRYNLEQHAPWGPDEVFMHQTEFPVGHYFHGSSAEHKVTLVRADARSLEFRRTLDDWLSGEKIDLAIVDAAHDYYTTRELFQHSLVRLNEGGIIFNDDFGRRSGTLIGVTECFAQIAREEGVVFYWFDPFPIPPEFVANKQLGYRDPSALILVNIPETNGLQYANKLKMQ